MISEAVIPEAVISVSTAARAWGFGALCWLTTAVRIYQAVETFRR